MVSPVLQKELLAHLERLSPKKQRKVIDFAKELAKKPKGVPGKELLHLAGTISKADCQIMMQAVDECRRIDPNDWK